MKLTKLLTIPRLRSGWRGHSAELSRSPCRAILVLALGLIVWSAKVSEAVPMGSVFTYQGRLIDSNTVAGGLYDFQFELYSDPCLSFAVYKVGDTIKRDEVEIIDGYFTVELDFGTWGIFTGDARWLQIGVRPGEMSDPAAYTILSPRQEVTPTPYALYAASSPGIPVPLVLSGSSPDPIISGANSGAGSGIYGEASNSGDITNYGGHFKAAGKYGRAVCAEATGESGRGVYGETSGKYGIGVQGTASGENSFGVYGFTPGSFGKGVYGNASKTGDVENYGGYFVAAGEEGRGVYGEATDTGDVHKVVQNYGGYFIARGVFSQGVHGETTGIMGVGVYGGAVGTNSSGVYGEHRTSGNYGYFGSSKYGVYGYANDAGDYDFYAGGPGINYGSSSSVRYKNNIRDIDNPIQKVMSLRGIYFNWDAEHGGQHDVGMVAEEVGQVLPEIVQYEEDGIYTSGMDYSKLTPLLVEAIKELKADKDAQFAELKGQLSQMELLRKENAELRQRVAALESIVTKFSKLQEGDIQ